MKILSSHYTYFEPVAAQRKSGGFVTLWLCGEYEIVEGYEVLERSRNTELELEAELFYCLKRLALATEEESSIVYAKDIENPDSRGMYHKDKSEEVFDFTGTKSFRIDSEIANRIWREHFIYIRQAYFPSYERYQELKNYDEVNHEPV